MIRLGVLGSTNGTDLQAILDAVSAGELDADVAVVISNRTGAYILKRAEINNVSAFFISHKIVTQLQNKCPLVSFLLQLQ